MYYTYFRVQQELAQMILDSLKANPSRQESWEIDDRLGSLMLRAESPSMQDLYDAGWRFGRWLNDTDIRQRDAEYDKLLTDEIRTWAETNIFKPDGAST